MYHRVRANLLSFDLTDYFQVFFTSVTVKTVTCKVCAHITAHQLKSAHMCEKMRERASENKRVQSSSRVRMMGANHGRGVRSKGGCRESRDVYIYIYIYIYPLHLEEFKRAIAACESRSPLPIQALRCAITKFSGVFINPNTPTRGRCVAPSDNGPKRTRVYIYGATSMDYSFQGLGQSVRRKTHRLFAHC